MLWDTPCSSTPKCIYQSENNSFEEIPSFSTDYKEDLSFVEETETIFERKVTLNEFKSDRKPKSEYSVTIESKKNRPREDGRKISILLKKTFHSYYFS